MGQLQAEFDKTTGTFSYTLRVALGISKAGESPVR